MEQQEQQRKIIRCLSTQDREVDKYIGIKKSIYNDLFGGQYATHRKSYNLNRKLKKYQIITYFVYNSQSITALSECSLRYQN